MTGCLLLMAAALAANVCLRPGRLAHRNMAGPFSPSPLGTSMSKASSGIVARLVRVRYCGDQSQVKLLLLDCDKEQADESFLPATPHALTRDGRLALAKKLKPNEDKGFTIMGSMETEEHPIGSPHAPDGDGWEHNGRKHTKSTFFDSRRAVKED